MQREDDVESLSGKSQTTMQRRATWEGHLASRQFVFIASSAHLFLCSLMPTLILLIIVLHFASCVLVVQLFNAHLYD